ncbi:M48 family metallopeptidase [Sneathiella limimaris]|uniref:M48 family metallopeptidase n=1 Tax=Sneathiella limimaris TaxID=1964213 RepID=UPI001469EAB1|nr:SprT family zinc-dependent metalloprotease [Sneathiella limimaris]
MPGFLNPVVSRPDRFKIQHLKNETAVDVWLVHSPRAKRLKLKVRHNGRVELVMPRGVSISRAQKFVEAEAHWVLETLENVEDPVFFEPGAIIPILGDDHLICHSPNGDRPVWQEANRLHVSGRKEHLARRVRDWLKQEARKKLLLEAELFSKKSGLKFGRVTIRDQKSRWGSCSVSGNLNFSWRLILMPEEALKYVVAHEIAHLKHMDHSPQFWRFLAEIYPEFEDPFQWMKKNAGRFHKYDATI